MSRFNYISPRRHYDELSRDSKRLRQNSKFGLDASGDKNRMVDRYLPRERSSGESDSMKIQRAKNVLD